MPCPPSSGQPKYPLTVPALEVWVLALRPDEAGSNLEIYEDDNWIGQLKLPKLCRKLPPTKRKEEEEADIPS